MSSAVVEFEGFQINANDYVIKELAFYAVDHGYHARWSFLPPYPWEQLSLKKRKTFSWLTRHLHGLRWNNGELAYSALEPILLSLFISFKTVFTKGLEKTKYLERLSGREILNLNDFGCPKIVSLNVSNVICPSHTFSFKHCALTKAVSYGMYIKDRLATSSIICVQDVDGGSSETAEQDQAKSSLS